MRRGRVGVEKFLEKGHPSPGGGEFEETGRGGRIDGGGIGLRGRIGGAVRARVRARAEERGIRVSRIFLVMD